VLAVTIGKEAFDDYKRYLRDRSANSTLYSLLDISRAPSSLSAPHSHHVSSTTDSPSSNSTPLKPTPSSNLKVGDLVHLEKNDRVPADILLLRTSDPSGTCFVRTDQLDGETDWKLRVAVERTQSLKNDGQLLEVEGEVYADPPTKDIHSFVGTLTFKSLPTSAEAEEEGDLVVSHPIEPLSAENMLWANTVLAAGSAVGMVVYTGRETRAVMNTSQPGTKTGLLDLEINRLAKVSTPTLLKLHGNGHSFSCTTTDLVCSDVCTLSHSRRSQRIQRSLVGLRIPILDSILLNHSYLVRHTFSSSSPLSPLIVAEAYASNPLQTASKSRYG